MSDKKKVRIWVTGEKLATNLIYRETLQRFMKTMNYINATYPEWQMIIVYDKESGDELKRYYNFDNKKTFPTSYNELY